MIPAYTADQVRAAEEPLLTAGVPLMARAARALEDAVTSDLAARAAGDAAGRAVFLIGSGNNGGDGLYAAAGLAREGRDVVVVLVGTTPHAGGLAAVRETGARVIDVSGETGDIAAERVVAAVAEPGTEVVVDAVTGIGVSGGLRGLPGAVVAALAERLVRAGDDEGRPVVVAVDVPSGIGVDDGNLPGPVLPADRTVTMGVVKAGLFLPPAAGVAGRVEVVELGLAPELAGVAAPVARLTAADVAGAIRVPGAASDKYRRGVVGALAGSEAYPGAAVLACSGAAPLAGMVRYAGPRRAADLVLARRPEVVGAPGRVQAWVLGSGIGIDDDERLAAARAVFAVVLAAGADSPERVPVVLDAGALELVQPGTAMPAWVVLTPHAGELARLLERLRGEGVTRAEVEAEPYRWLRAAVALTGATVVLKGSVTLVAGPTGPVYAQTGAPAWLATAGAGDVLAGMLGGMLAGQSEQVLQDPGAAARVAAAAVQLHADAASAASEQADGGPILALDVAEAIAPTVGGLLHER